MKDKKQEFGGSPVSAGTTVGNGDGGVFSGRSPAIDDIILLFSEIGW